jgi:hypothetical protein
MDGLIERIGKVEFQVFDYLVQIVITNDIIRSRNSRSHMIGNDYTGTVHVGGLHSYNDSRKDSYLFVNPDADANTIAHECFHAVHRMFEYLGAEIEEEITAYYLGFLVGEVTKLVNEKPALKRQKKK